MVASPAVIAGGGAAIVVVLVFAIFVRGRRRRARQRKHEAYLDDLAHAPAVEPLPEPVPPMEAILVEAEPPALPRRGGAPLAAAEPEPEPAAQEVLAPPSPERAPAPEPAMACRADQLAMHVAELAAQTAALTDAVIDLVARGAQPQTIVVAAPAHAPAAEPQPEPAAAPEPAPEPVEFPEPLAFQPIGAPVPERAGPELEPEPVRDPRMRELVLHPPARPAVADAFDWPSDSELRAFARTQVPRDDR